MLLLYDSCHSADTAITPARSSRGTTEVIAACGFEAIAPEVGEHSFTNALSHVLAMASEGSPFFVSDLHNRLLARLKNWVPSPLKDNEERFIKDHQGFLVMEPQRRKAPVHCILSTRRNRRGILLMPLPQIERGSRPSVHIGPRPNFLNEPLSTTVGAALSGPGSARFWQENQSISGSEFIMTVTLSDEVASGRQEPDTNAWLEWLRSAPLEAREIEIGLKMENIRTPSRHGTDESLRAFQILSAEHDPEAQSDEDPAAESWNHSSPWIVTSGPQDDSFIETMAPGFSFFDQREQNQGSSDQDDFIPAGASVIADMTPDGENSSECQATRRSYLPTGHRLGPWSQAEDAYLVQLVHTQGPLNWVRIAQLIGSRSPKQCRERYHQTLKPSLNQEPISHEEGLQIERLVAEMGTRWAEIAHRLDGRGDNAVKNWWNGSLNRRRRLARRKNISAPQLPILSFEGRSHLYPHVRTVISAPL